MPSAIIRIDGTFDKLVDKIEQIPNSVFARGADRMLASLGSEARKLIGAKQAHFFDMNSTKTKFYKGQFVTKRPTWDSSHGWYKGSQNTRIIGFSYESTAYKKGNKKKKLPMIGTMSVGYAYSLIHNLWGQDAIYKTKSPPFHSDAGYPKYWGSYGVGKRDKRETGFTESTVQQAIAPALERAEKDLSALLREEGY